MASYVTHTDGDNYLPTMDAVDRCGFVSITDGTNTLALSDTGAVNTNQGTKTSDLSNAWPTRVTDGSHYQPTMDAVARPGFVKITNGSYTADVTSTGCIMTCPSISFSAMEAKANRLFMTTGDFSMALKDVAYTGMLFKNPLGSGLEVYIRNISLANLTATGHVFCRIYSNPTITNIGTNTAINTTCANISAIASSVVHTDTNITFSNIGTHLTSNVSYTEQSTLDFDYGLLMQPNTSLLLVFQSSANNQTVTTNITYTQVLL